MQKQINKIIKAGVAKAGVDLERGDVPFPVVANVMLIYFLLLQKLLTVGLIA